MKCILICTSKSNLFRNGALGENLLHTAGNPKIPTLAEAMDEVLSDAEKEAFVNYLRPLYEAGEGRSRQALAYLWAVKSSN